MKTEKQGRSETLLPVHTARINKISAEMSHSSNSKTRRFIDEKQYSAITEIALPTLRRWRHERKGPPYIKIGRMVRYDYDLGMAFMDSHKVDLGR